MLRGILIKVGIVLLIFLVFAGLWRLFLYTEVCGC
jgi:hypothetical protein